MSKRFSILLVVLTIISGLISGALSGRVFAVKPIMTMEERQSKVLTVEGLKIVDKSGKLLMKLGTFDDRDYSTIRIYNEYGEIGTLIGVDQFGGSNFIATDKDDKLSVSMSVIYGFGSSISVSNKDDNATVSMSATQEGGSFCIFEKGTLGAEMSVNENGGRLDMFGKGDNPLRASIGVNEYGNGSIGLWDKNGYRLK